MVSSAAAIDLSQSLDKASIAYEEEAVLTITVRWSGSQSAYLFDRPVQPELEKLKVQKFSTSVSSQATDIGEVTTKTFSFTLIPVGSGTGRIQPMTIHYVSWPDSLPGDLATTEMSVNIAAARPVQKSSGISSRLKPAIWIPLAALLAGGAGVGTMLYLKRRRKPVVEVKSPGKIFLEGLSALATDAGSDLKRFQTGLYKLLVSFIHDQYGLEVAGKSADEIAQAVVGTSLSESQKAKLSGWLIRADREKFSPLPPAPGETIRLETELRQFFEAM
ncbi:MAG: BatD family protein [candidate division Zixibacteria bacterium]|nr:BatD family protein [candidate division Zixibacteria bacterium]